ncbi:MAG: hypothetical protein KGM17_01140 [Sphingomonadales bacterium]|nr:hypothetical protein [Sphingomonadales bacterium]
MNAGRIAQWTVIVAAAGIWGYYNFPPRTTPDVGKRAEFFLRYSESRQKLQFLTNCVAGNAAAVSHFSAMRDRAVAERYKSEVDLADQLEMLREVPPGEANQSNGYFCKAQGHLAPLSPEQVDQSISRTEAFLKNGRA